MFTRVLIGIAAGWLAAAAPLSGALAADPPPAAATSGLFDPLKPLIGKTWRGKAPGKPGVEDVVRWEWAVGGHAVRAIHSINDGAYGGETLIFPDKTRGVLIFHYFTTGGFHTTGTIRPGPESTLEIDEEVHGASGITRLISTGRFMPDGSYQTRSRSLQDGKWVEFGGFDYRVDANARVVLPEPGAREAAVSAGTLRVSRRMVRQGPAGEDVAGYLRVDNASDRPDALVAVSCDCARRVELHAIRADAAGNPDMVVEASLVAPARGALDIRPRSPLHLMLIGYDPGKTADGKARLRLTFRDAGVVEADFALVDDSAAAWAAFD